MAQEDFFFTWSAQKDPKRLEVQGGEGPYLIDHQGERWLDLGSLSYQANLGYSNQAIIAGIQEQAARLCFAPPYGVFPEKRELARRLLEKAPAGFDRVLFTLGGSDANENALKLARLFSGKHKVITRYRSYHGASLGAASVSGDWRRPPVEPGLVGCHRVLDLTDQLHLGQEELPAPSQIPEMLKLEGNVGAVLLEPVVGANGVLWHGEAELGRIRAGCDEAGALLIFDEVLSGVGRTGRFFAYEHFGVTPDIITLGKGITAGYGPLGAVLVHERISAHFDDNVLVAGLTHYAHPLSIRIALETLREMERMNVLDAVAPRRDQLASQLAGWRGSHGSLVGKSRVQGLLSATHLHLSSGQFGRLQAELRKRRVLCHLRADTQLLILAPPLTITEDELQAGLQAVHSAIVATAAAQA